MSTPEDPYAHTPYPAPHPPHGYGNAFGQATGGWPAHDGPDDPLISRDYGGWWRRGVAIAKLAWPKLAPLQAVNVVLATALNIPLTLQLVEIEQRLTDAAKAGGEGPALSDLYVTGGLTLAGALGIGLISLIIYMISVRVVVAAATGTPESVGTSFRLSLRRLFPLLGWGALAYLLILAAVCACLLPAFYVGAVLFLLPVVVAVERTNAISRCFRLFHADLGSALARLATIIGARIAVALVFALIGMIAGAGTALAAPDPASVAPSAWLGIGIAAVQSIVMAVLSLLLMPLYVLTYADMRARCEQTTSETIKSDLGMA